MTFLEIVFASALLAMLAATVFSLFGFIARSSWRQKQRLATMELANRVMLQYIDEPTSVDSMSRKIPYLGCSYRWDIGVEQVKLAEPRADQRVKTISGVKQTRFRQVAVRVWLDQDAAGAAVPRDAAPEASLVRLMDPVFGIGNPEKMAKIFDPARPEAAQAWMQQLMGAIEGGERAPAPTGATGRAPARGTGRAPERDRGRGPERRP